MASAIEPRSPVQEIAEEQTKEKRREKRSPTDLQASLALIVELQTLLVAGDQRQALAIFDPLPARNHTSGPNSVWGSLPAYLPLSSLHFLPTFYNFASKLSLRYRSIGILRLDLIVHIAGKAPPLRISPQMLKDFTASLNPALPLFAPNTSFAASPRTKTGQDWT